MICAEAVKKILEAEAAELQGLGGGPLAEHIRSCAQCRRAAETVVEGQHRLGAELTRAVKPPDLDSLLKRLGEESGNTGSEAVSAIQGRQAKAPASFRRWGWPLLPLAAAAALVALFLGGQPQLPGDPYTPPRRTAGLGLEVPEGQNVAVLATNNPDITVLWFF